MALFIPGMLCPLCKKPMTNAGEVIMFAPFLGDRSDPLFVFSDATIHSACFVRHPLSEQASRWHDQVLREGRPSNRICEVCRELVLDPDDGAAQP